MFNLLVLSLLSAYLDSSKLSSSSSSGLLFQVVGSHIIVGRKRDKLLAQEFHGAILISRSSSKGQPFPTTTTISSEESNTTAIAYGATTNHEHVFSIYHIAYLRTEHGLVSLTSALGYAVQVRLQSAKLTFLLCGRHENLFAPTCMALHYLNWSRTLASDFIRMLHAVHEEAIR